MKNRSKKIKNTGFIIGIILCIAVTIFIGNHRNIIHEETLINHALSDINTNIISINSNKWIVNKIESNNELGFIYIGKGNGYNGSIQLLVHCDTNLIINSIKIFSQSETHSYFKLLLKNDFLKSFIGIDIRKTNTIDAISGATRSSLGIKNGIISAYRLGEGLSINSNNKFNFGVLEFLIIILFILSIANTKIQNKKLVKTIWILSLILSIVFLGFIYNHPITTSRINSLLIGSWPSFYTDLSIYILLFGSIISILLTGKNHYCHSICPFGSSQEIIGMLGNAKNKRFKFSKHLKKIQWSTTLVIILIALFLHNPGITEYEIYGGLFSLTASIAGFVLLIIIILSSLFIKRPWCNYLCPLDGFFKFFKIIRKEIISLFS